MNNEYETVGLYAHNIASYNRVKAAFETDERVVGIVHATGTGKSYNALELAYDNKKLKTLYIVPSIGIIDHIKEIIESNPNLSLERDFPNLNFITYQSLINMSYEELKNLDIDLLILDEFHHIGAPIWGARITTIDETHPNMKIFGMTAYTIRDRGTPYERDMANPNGNELFSNKIVSRYDLCDAIIDGVLPKPIYKCAYTDLIGIESDLEKKVQKYDATSKEYQEYMSILLNVKRQIQKAPGIPSILRKTIKPNGKYIYFCPPCSEEGTNDIETIKKQAMEWFKQFIPEEDIVFYTSTSSMGSIGKRNRDAFYNDVTLDGEDAHDKLQIMFAINQYNEGIHAPNIDGVIMGRGTASDIVFFEQLGRGLAVRGNTKEKYEELEAYSIENLKKMCKERDISFSESITKNELIEKLIAPVIIDLTDNYDFIKELENNLRDRIKQIEIKGTGAHRKIKIQDVSFDVEVEDQDLYKMLMYVKDRLSNTWDNFYEYAKIYYNHYGNLEVPYRFRTNNGYTYDEEGLIYLGQWITNQRRSTSLGSDQRQKLLEIGMRFEKKRLTWEEMYEYAKIYYNHHGNLEVPYRFRTNDGYTYDEDGLIYLGQWIINQRRNASLESDQKKKLIEIGMRFEKKTSTLWEEMYEYAKIYYNHHGNLEVHQMFKTNDGYTYDENGLINLGFWIGHQRQNTPIESERGKKLLEIGMRFETKNPELWEKMYEYAKVYYNHHGNLEIPQTFKTNDGYTYDENGIINLGRWLAGQRRFTSPESERGKKLLEIGMRFEKKKSALSWEKIYEYAKTYYNHHGNLEVPRTFKTNDGYTYDENGLINLGIWIVNQRSNTPIESERGKKLLEIGMRFENKKIMIPWEKMYEYAKIYYNHHGNLEVPLTFKTNDGYTFDEQGLINLGMWIRNQRRDTSVESERGKKLLEIGMRFENKKIILSWEEMYEYAKIYYNHHGDLEVPYKFKTNDGYTYDENGLINLGLWIYNQRSKISIESEQGQKLLEIGMRFTNKNLKWEEMYEYARIYYNHHGNLEVPRNFKTSDGYNYDENGSNLGRWIIDQRIRISIESEQGLKLSQIGMIWNVKKNKEEIITICTEHNIDYEKNKTILSHISVQELVAKLEFLKFLNHTLVNEQGALHEIFFMSNPNMKEKYGITLEEMIMKYYIESDKRKGV